MINQLGRIAAKARGRDLRELRVRGEQLVVARLERLGVLRDRVDDDARALVRRLAPERPHDPEALRDAFRAAPPPFFAGLDDRAATVAALRTRVPHDAAEVLARAERVLAARFDLIGYRALDYGRPIDWQRDPVAGRRADGAVHWSRVPYLDPDAVGDHKVIWELSRQQYLVTLGQAYWYTGEERYAEGALALLDLWIDANAGKRGINWASNLELAFRAMSWLWALQLFRESVALTPARYVRILSSLHVHARHLETFLSTYFSPNTHLTGEALGLVMIGALAPELAHAERWRRIGEDILLEQIALQQRADGTYFEQATQYHRYTTEFYLQLQLLTERQGRPVDPRLAAAVPRLVDVLAHLARPDGTIPLVGDDDGGRLVQLDGRAPDDVRALLLAAAAMARRNDWAWVGQGGAAHAGEVAPLVWLLGPAALGRLDDLTPTPPPGRSHAFPDGGLYVLRDGWNAAATHVVFDCGAHGVFNYGHAHADALALTLTVGGRPVLVDAGTYSYPGIERNAFRGGAAHNALLVDGVGSSEPAAGAFQWRRAARSSATEWVADAAFDLAGGTQDGFESLPDPVRHARHLFHLPGRALLVRDALGAQAGHAVEARWHLAPGLRAAVVADRWSTIEVRTADGQPVLRLAASVTGGEGTWEVEDGWVSPRYGAREPSVVLVFRCSIRGDAELATLLLPPDDEGRWPVVEPVDVVAMAGGPAGSGCRVHWNAHDLAGAVDLLSWDVAGRARRVDDLVLTGSLVWARGVAGAAASSRPDIDRMLVVGGEFPDDLVGTKLGRTASSAEWRLAERDGDGWRIRGGTITAPPASPLPADVRTRER